MRRILSRATRVLDAPIDVAPRAIMTAAEVLMLTIYVVPLWNLTMFAPQYPQGLRLDIRSYKLESGNEGQDLTEINVLNHYIGMRGLVWCVLACTPALHEGPARCRGAGRALDASMGGPSHLVRRTPSFPRGRVIGTSGE